MRVIAGEFRSRRLSFPKSRTTRPMMERAKKIIFDILSQDIRGAAVLDLFAGSGSLGLEALSRGARSVTFVEREPAALKALWKNVDGLGLQDRSQIFREDVFRSLRKLERRGQKFTVIFLDPPYNQGLVRKALKHLDRSDIVTGQTRLVVHHSRQEKLPEGLERLKGLRERRFGQACLSFLSLNEGALQKIRERISKEEDQQTPGHLSRLV